MFSLYRLILKTNIKSPVIAFPLVTPIIFLLIFSVNIADQEDLANAIITIFALITLQSGVFGFGFTLIEMKKSVMLRRIGATKISKSEAISAIILYGLTIWLITIIWLLLVITFLSGVGFFKDNNGNIVRIPWTEMSWSIIIFATIISLFLSFPLGLFFVSISKDDQQYGVYASLYFFGAAFLGGMFFPNVNIKWMEYTSYFIPHSYNLEMYQAASFNVAFGDLFNWSDGYNLVDSNGNIVGNVEGWKAALNFWVPIGCSAALLGISLKTFKWES